MSQSHYDTLEVSHAASDAVIRASYKALVQKYHPDRYQPQEEAERITKTLGVAYSVLSDPDQRRAYDEMLRAGPPAEEPPQQESNHSPPSAAPPSKNHGFGWGFWLAILGGVLLLKLVGLVPILVWWAVALAWGATAKRGRGTQFGVATAIILAGTMAWLLLLGVRAKPAASAAVPAASSQQWPPSDAGEVAQAAVAAPAAPDDHWNRLIATWKASNAEFVSDPQRLKVMSAAIQAIDAEHQGNISDGRLIALAEDRAFTTTGWKFRDPQAWTAEWNRLMAQWQVQNQQWLQDQAFVDKMNAAINALQKEQQWARPSDLLAAAEQRVIQQLRTSNDAQNLARAAAQQAARHASRNTPPPAPDRAAMELQCHRAFEAANNASPPGGSIAQYAQWRREHQSALDACLARLN